MIVNTKLALQFLPAALLACLQSLFASASILLMGCASIVLLDHADRSIIRLWIPHAALLSFATYISMIALQSTSIITMVVVRSLCPILVSLMDFFLKKMLVHDNPIRFSPQSHAEQKHAKQHAVHGHVLCLRPSCSLMALVAGGVCYVMVDASQGEWQAWSWTSAWGFMISLESVIMKRTDVVHTKFTSIWTLSLYSNTLGLAPLSLIWYFSEQQSPSIFEAAWTFETGCQAFLSCLCGAGIVWTTWKCRLLTSALCFSLMGVTSKVASVLIALFVLDGTTSTAGLASLVLCLTASATYQLPQAEHEITRTLL